MVNLWQMGWSSTIQPLRHEMVLIMPSEEIRVPRSVWSSSYLGFFGYFCGSFLRFFVLSNAILALESPEYQCSLSSTIKDNNLLRYIQLNLLAGIDLIVGAVLCFYVEMLFCWD